MNGLSIGFAMAGLTVFVALRSRYGAKSARKGLPVLAEELGLTFKPSPYKTGIGKLTGVYAGFRVVVDPDDTQSIRISLEQPLGLELRSSLERRPLRNEQRRFEPSLREVARALPTCQGTEAAIGRFEAAPSAPEVARFLKLHTVKSLILTESGLTVHFDFGRPPHLPPKVVKETLTLLTRFLVELGAEPGLSAGGGNSENPGPSNELS